MATTHYEVQHRYAAFRDGRQLGPWVEGDRVELSPADAEWVNRDSPGCLLCAGGAVEDAPIADEDEPEREKPAGANRQARPGRNRGRS